MNSTQNWRHYQDQLTKYLLLLSDNPYIGELREDFKTKKVNRFISSFNDNKAKEHIRTLISNGKIDDNTIDNINTNFSSLSSLKYFSQHISDNVLDKHPEKLLNCFQIDSITNFKKIHKNEIPKLKFKPTDLKFVTTTAIAFLDTNVDFKELYERYSPPKKILKDEAEHIYCDEVVGKVVGCKTGSSPIKGLFKKDSIGDFYNCCSLNVVLGVTKEANIKIFNNGKLQMTGIPKPEIGEKV